MNFCKYITFPRTETVLLKYLKI